MATRRTTFRPLSPRRNLAEALVRRLSAQITSGKLHPSERLPTEQEMIASFGVSRTVVREAIAALRAQGLVETRQGAGAFVSRDPNRRPFRIDPAGLRSLQGVLDVMELRMSVEIEAAALAAERHDAKSLRRIDKTLKAFETAIAKGDSAVDADYDFHCAVCAATGNPYYESFLGFLGRLIIPRQSIRVQAIDPPGQAVYLRRVLAEHRAIARAIAANDPGAARRAMRKHIRHGRERYRKLLAQQGGD
jgi:DNA-binding FadR family transcriptional regulator